MNEVNTMLIVVNNNKHYTASATISDDRSQDTRPATPNTQAEAFFIRGQIFERKGDYHLAIRDYQHALEINPGLVNAAYSKAACLNKLGNFEDAINTYN